MTGKPLIDRIRDETEVPWNELREQKVLRQVRLQKAAIKRKAEQSNPAQHGRTRLILVASMCSVLVAVLTWFGLYFTFSYPRSESESMVNLGIGCKVTLSSEAEVAILHETSEEIVLRQENGQARYDIDPEHGKTFIVIASDVHIRVVGTVFTVTSNRGGVRVEVDRGTVEVSHQQRSVLLAAGEEARFRTTSASNPRPILLTDQDPGQFSERNSPERRDSRSSSETRDHRSTESEPTHDDIEVIQNRSDEPMPTKNALGQAITPTDRETRPAQIQVNERMTEVQTQPENEVEHQQTTASILMRQADEARRARRLREAVELLNRALELSNAQQRPTILFTLGRVEEMRGRPRSAARAFSRCRQADPYGSLIEDALAAEARNAASAGMRNRSRQLANQYLEGYPGGSHSATMRGLLADNEENHD